MDVPKGTTKWAVGVVLLAVLAGAQFYVGHINAEAAQGEVTRTRLAIVERKADENDEWKRDVKRELRDMRAEVKEANNKLDKLEALLQRGR